MIHSTQPIQQFVINIKQPLDVCEVHFPPRKPRTLASRRARRRRAGRRARRRARRARRRRRTSKRLLRGLHGGSRPNTLQRTLVRPLKPLRRRPTSLLGALSVPELSARATLRPSSSLAILRQVPELSTKLADTDLRNLHVVDRREGLAIPVHVAVPPALVEQRRARAGTSVRCVAVPPARRAKQIAHQVAPEVVRGVVAVVAGVVESSAPGTFFNSVRLILRVHVGCEKIVRLGGARIAEGIEKKLFVAKKIFFVSRNAFFMRP
ncbi:unnamed protein product [Sphacelaria rigidula]